MFFIFVHKFHPAYSSAKIIKIKRVFPQLWSQMFCHVLCESLCIPLIQILSLPKTNWYSWAYTTDAHDSK